MLKNSRNWLSLISERGGVRVLRWTILKLEHDSHVELESDEANEVAIAAIIAEIDAEIGRHQQARELLSTDGSDATPKAKRGRPKGSAKKATAAKVSAKANKRVLSPEGRKAIADAMKRR